MYFIKLIFFSKVEIKLSFYNVIKAASFFKPLKNYRHIDRYFLRGISYFFFFWIAWVDTFFVLKY